MGGEYKERYGIPGPEVKNLSKRYYARNLREGFYYLDTFLLWCSQNGYKKGLTLQKRDETLPHSTENSYFEDSNEARRKRTEKHKEFMATKSVFCDGCTQECPGGGCRAWQAHWKENWDKNIYVPPAKPVVQEGPMVFRYEHPDLVREGIVFDPSR